MDTDLKSLLMGQEYDAMMKVLDLSGTINCYLYATGKFDLLRAPGMLTFEAGSA